jgi:hypothetical protein
MNEDNQGSRSLNIAPTVEIEKLQLLAESPLFTV